MDSQSLFNIAVGISGALGGWILKVIWDAINDLKSDMKALTREVNQDFLRKEDFRESITELKSDMRDGFREVKDAINLLFERVNEKADK